MLFNERQMGLGVYVFSEKGGKAIAIITLKNIPIAINGVCISIP